MTVERVARTEAGVLVQTLAGEVGLTFDELTLICRIAFSDTDRGDYSGVVLTVYPAEPPNAQPFFQAPMKKWSWGDAAPMFCVSEFLGLRFLVDDVHPRLRGVIDPFNALGVNDALARRAAWLEMLK